MNARFYFQTPPGFVTGVRLYILEQRLLGFNVLTTAFFTHSSHVTRFQSKLKPEFTVILIKNRAIRIVILLV